MPMFSAKNSPTSAAKKKSSRRAGSFAVEQPTPVPILVRPRGKGKQTAEKYEALITFLSKPENREAIHRDVPRNGKKVQWDNVAVEITLEVNQSPRFQKKFVKLNDEKVDEVVAQCAKEFCVAVPAVLNKKLKDEPKVPLHVCTKKCFVVDENGKSSVECPWNQPRSNRDYSTLVPVLRMPAMDNSRSVLFTDIRDTIWPVFSVTYNRHLRNPFY